MALPENKVFLALQELATCLCGLIPSEGLPEVCFCGVVPGDSVSAMYGGDCSKKCAMAWVRLVTSVPASGIGVQNVTPFNCASGVGFDVEVGIMRCTPIGEAERPPSDAVLLAATELQVADMMVMRKAVACCGGSAGWILGAYSPLGPLGGMLGGAWSVQMWSP